MPTKQQIKELNQHFALEDDTSAIELLYGDIPPHERDDEGRSAVHYIADFGRIEIFDEVVPGLNMDVNAQDDRGRTPLHVAALGGHAEMCSFIVTKFTVNLNAHDEKGWTPLHLASQRGHDKVVKVLITLGANPLLQDISAKTALDVAATDRCKKILYLHTPSVFSNTAVAEPDRSKVKSRFDAGPPKLKSRFD